MLFHQAFPLLVTVASAAVLSNTAITSKTNKTSGQVANLPWLTHGPANSTAALSSPTGGSSIKNGISSVSVSQTNATTTKSEYAGMGTFRNATDSIRSMPSSTSISVGTYQATTTTDLSNGSNKTASKTVPMSGGLNETDTESQSASALDFEDDADDTEDEDSFDSDIDSSNNTTKPESTAAPNLKNGNNTMKSAIFSVADSETGTNSTENELFSLSSIKYTSPKVNTPLVIDTFNDTNKNALGFYHGVSGDVKITEFEESDGGSALKVSTGDVDAAFVTTLAEGCNDYSGYRDHYVHIHYNGSAKFSVSVQQHNRECDDSKAPFPRTWDSVQASRYSSKDGQDIYIPMSHFHVDLKQINGIALESWYTNDTTYINKIEVLPPGDIPKDIPKVKKLESGTLHVGCSQPGLIAFGIDDGSPEYVQRTLGIIKEENIPVTFFVQGSALTKGLDEGNNFTAAYKEMIDAGHQIAYHTMSHPHMESVQDEAEIEKQITDNIAIFKDKLGVESRYFRPPFGTIGSRTRQAAARHIRDPQHIMWSIDVKDWVYGLDPEGDPDRKQYKAFEQSLNKGGDIVVAHYLYKSTVDQLRDMIKLAKAQGRQFVRADQCVGDPEAPEIWGWKRQ